MDVLARPIIPPAPKVPAQDLPFWRLMLTGLRNTVAVWPEHAFDDLISSNTVRRRTAFLVNDPQAARRILGPGAAHYGRSQLVSRVTRPLAGAGLLLSEGADWRRQRKMLAPMFNPASVALFLPHFMAAAEAMARRLEGAARANLSALFHEAALEAVLRALFSLAPDQQRGMARMVRDYIGGPGRPKVLDGFAKGEEDFRFDTGGRRRFQRVWFAAVEALIAARKAQSKAMVETGAHRDLLDLLLAARDPETGAGLTDAEVRDQCATMLFAGFETTSRLLFWASYLLTLDPTEQVRIRREVQAAPPQGVTRLEHLNAWPRLRQLMLETLRLDPSAPNMVRRALADDEILGRHVPAGSSVWISPWVMHRHRKLWDRPTAFIPDRFAGQASPWTSGAFIPFGGGPRICIGASFAMAEAQIVLATLLSRFEISLERPRMVTPVGQLTLAPDHEPWFKVLAVQGRP